jgi:HD superfamily phosphodiesterase
MPNTLSANSMKLPTSVAGVPVPDSAIAIKAAELAASTSPASLVNHCLRTYAFAALALQKAGTKVDRELAFVAATLHDLGLVEQFMTPEGRFELDGADAARAFLLEAGLSAERAEIVWDAIAFHTTMGIVDRKAPEVAAVSLGARIDVAGMGLEQFTASEIAEILEAFPRLAFKEEFVELIVTMCRKKPLAQIGQFTAEIGRRHVSGFACPTVDQLAMQAPYRE